MCLVSHSEHKVLRATSVRERTKRRLGFTQRHCWPQLVLEQEDELDTLESIRAGPFLSRSKDSVVCED